MSKIHLEANFLMDSVKVYIYDRDVGGRVNLFVYDGGDKWRIESISETDALPEVSTFTLKRDHLEALVAAASDFLPPSGAQSRHLEDALKIRDRILTLLEAERGDGRVRSERAEA